MVDILEMCFSMLPRIQLLDVQVSNISYSSGHTHMESCLLHADAFRVTVCLHVLDLHGAQRSPAAQGPFVRVSQPDYLDRLNGSGTTC